MNTEAIRIIDAAFEKLEGRTFATKVEMCDILLDARLALMEMDLLEGEINGIVPIEDDALVGADFGTS